MPEPRIFRDRVYEAGTKYHRGRLVDRDGDIQVQGDYTGTVTLKVFDLASDDADTAVYSNTAITVASVVTNTLQTWDTDSTGWNFEHGVTSNNLTWEGGHTYRVCYFLTNTSEGVHSLMFEDTVEPSLGA
jgi:hypothetical protein